VSDSTHPPVKAFLFDMGDVLIKFSHSRMFAQISEVLRRPVEDVKRLFQDTGLFVGYDRGDVDDDEALSRIEAFVGRPVDQRRLLHALSDIFEPSPGMFELLTELKRRGYRMVLLSNTCRPHIEFVRERFPIYGLLDDYTLSFEVRAMKPEAAIFEAAISKVGVPPENCFYTDDISRYVEAGRSHGLQAEVFSGVENLKLQLAERGIEV
jgi:putative hydrolase of the HAD superfamily